MMINRATILFLGCAALLAAAPAAAQQPTDSVYELRVVEVAPRALNGADMAAALNASYPAALRDAGVSGTVRVSMIVGADGMPRDARVVESADSAFHAPTLAAVQTLRFSPAELNDRPVSVRVELPIVWQAPAPVAAAETPPVPAASDDNPPAPDPRHIYELVEVTQQPRPINARDLLSALETSYPPSLRNARTSGRVEVRFVVETNGRPGGIAVLSTSDPAFNDATIQSVSRLRFEPARRNGQLVRVWVELPIEWHVQQ